MTTSQDKPRVNFWRSCRVLFSNPICDLLFRFTQFKFW